MKLKLEIMKETISEKEEMSDLEKARKDAFGNKGIMCMCVKCFGLGFAADKSDFDENDILVGIKCPCGGRIKRLVK